jgi:ribonucleotide reductase alpha subunit
VKEDADWYLMDPNICPGLSDCYGEEYEKLYTKYCDLGTFSKKIKAREIWTSIINSQIETGTPYILFKDHINRNSNQKNLGTIKSSNLCAEIAEYSDHEEYACCTLASLGLPLFVEDGSFNFVKLEKVVRIVVNNLNKIIDRNYYPVPEAKRSNLRHRPTGIGIQGLADVFALMGLAFDSDEAKLLNTQIAETIYYASMKASCELSKLYANDKRMFINKINEIQKLVSPIDSDMRNDIECYINYLKKKDMHDILDKDISNDKLEIINFWDTHPSLKYESFNSNILGAYSTFEGSPLSQGFFQFDLSNHKPSDRYNWEELREDVKTNGVRNSLLVALMPTATTSQILGNNECFEPYTSNIYRRRTLAGDFTIVNKHLMSDLNKLGIWSKSLKDEIIKNNGSIQGISDIPENIKNKYKIVWELKQRDIIEMAIDRSHFVCQTQSMNLFFKDPNMSNLTSALFYGWEHGLKTGCYYIRSQPEVQAQQFTIKIDSKSKPTTNIDNIDNSEIENCDSCGA